MKKIALTLAAIVVGLLSLSAQEKPSDSPMAEPVSITYRQTDEVRNELGLDYKQFEKVYKAYKKYNDAVYGADPVPGHRFGGGGGRPGGHGGGHDFGGGRPPMGGRPGMMPNAGSAPKKVDPAKLEKTKIKQEEKLRKSMKKIFKSDGDYNRWLQIRERQLSTQPGPAAPPLEPVIK